ncbi:ABC transporter ATP-binding protein [Nonomuraea sp. NPDC050022]|uniref:ABC transporter ATP-binding protein n=1 Tax=unclassified Nonomuraea TaxID=2593643 RepID=UPI00340ED784
MPGSQTQRAAKVGDSAVAIDALVKRYPGAPANAVDELFLEVRPGEIFGLLGPNGAGKSTTIGILTTRVIPTGGTATILGVDVVARPVAARRLLGVVPQVNNLDRSLNAWQNLLFHAAYHGVPRAVSKSRATELMESFGLAGRGRDSVNTYSGGMAQRLLIARALMHDPRVLFLDEPTTGLDPQARLFVWDRIRELRAAGVTVVLTTHDMDEAADLSDRVGIIDHGKLLALGTVHALTRGLEGKSMLDITIAQVPGPAARELPDVLASQGAQEPPGARELLDVLADVDGVERVERVESAPAEPAMSETRFRLYVSQDPAAVLGPVAQLLAKRDCPITNVQIGEPSLEDVFITLTGRSLR